MSKYEQALEAALSWFDPHLINGISYSEFEARARFAWQDFERAKSARDARRRTAAQAVKQEPNR